MSEEKEDHHKEPYRVDPLPADLPFDPHPETADQEIFCGQPGKPVVVASDYDYMQGQLEQPAPMGERRLLRKPTEARRKLRQLAKARAGAPYQSGEVVVIGGTKYQACPQGKTLRRVR